MKETLGSLIDDMKRMHDINNVPEFITELDRARMQLAYQIGITKGILKSTKSLKKVI